MGGPEEPPTLRLSLGNRVHMEWSSGKWQWHADTRSSPDAGPRLKPQCQPCSGNAYQHGTWQCQHSQDCPTVGETSPSSHGKSYCGFLSQPLPLTFLRDRVFVCCVEKTHVVFTDARQHQMPWSCELPACQSSVSAEPCVQPWHFCLQ